jgi:hypothetical protein
MDGVKLIIHNFNVHGEFRGFCVEFMEAGDLLSHLPVVKVFNLMLQVDKVATGSLQEELEPCREWFNGVLFAMSNGVSLCV